MIEAAVPPQEAAHTVPEILGKQHHKPIETESVRLGMDHVELAAFMEEPVEIQVAELREDSGMLGFPITVNSDVQWVMGGATQTIKRKYVEVLARARTTTYKQHNDPTNPAASRPIPRTVFSYPFSVIRDSEKGKAWLKEILNQPG